MINLKIVLFLFGCGEVDDFLAFILFKNLGKDCKVSLCL